jgi:biotin carboxylase
MSLCIVFNQGSVSAGELLVALESQGSLVFAVREDDAYACGFTRLLATAGTVVELRGDTTADAAGLKAAHVTGITTFGESGIQTTAALAAELGLPYHSVAVARALTDKHTQRALLEAADVGGVANRLIRGVADWDAAVADLGLPLVLKPRSGEGSRNTHLAAGAAAGRELVARLLDRSVAGHEQELVAEEYLVGVDLAPYGNYVSVESVCTDDGIRHIGVTGKLPLVPPFRETGQFHPAALTADLRGEVEELTTAALRALGVCHGVTHTEVKLTAEGPRIIEVNGRLGGYIAELYQRSLGVELVRAVADLALGRRVSVDGRHDGQTRFQYYSRPPLGATRLTAATGRRALLGHPAVDAYLQCVKPGSDLPADMSSSYLDRISGSASTPEAAARALDNCLPLLTYEFDTPDGTVALDGATLRTTNGCAGGS